VRRNKNKRQTDHTEDEGHRGGRAPPGGRGAGGRNAAVGGAGDKFPKPFIEGFWICRNVGVRA